MKTIEALATPNYYTAALIGSDSWSGTTGVPVNLTYSFAYSTEGGSLFGDAAKAAANSAMQAWSRVANVSFTQVSSNADITFSKADLDSYGAAGVTFSTASGTKTLHAEVQIDDDYTNFAPGSFEYLTVLHEVGHSLGLKHPAQYGSDQGPFLPADQDRVGYTVMSYEQSFNAQPITPQIFDIAALQVLYGAKAFNPGNDEYRPGTGAFYQTIWDSGGTDTLYVPSGQNGGRVDLREGLLNYSTFDQNTVRIAFGAHIENAVGLEKDDGLQGNGLNNQLVGGLGNDTLFGGDGTDTLYGGRSIADAEDVGDRLSGGRGSDLVFGNAGDDTIYGGRDVADAEDAGDIVYGGKGADSIFGNSGDDFLYGGGSGVDPLDQADQIFGGKGADFIYGNGGNDTLYGGGSSNDPGDQADVLFGGDGADLMFGNGGNDTLIGAQGNDTMHGGAGADRYAIETGGGRDLILLFEGANAAGGDVLAIARNLNDSGIVDFASLTGRIAYGGGNASIDLGGGNSVTIAGVTGLSAGDFDFV